MLTEPVIALTVELAANVIRISSLFFRYCCILQFSAILFAFNSSSSVMPPFTAAATTTDTPPYKMAAMGISANDEFFATWRISTDLILYLHSVVRRDGDWLYTFFATSLERVSHPAKPVITKSIKVTFPNQVMLELPNFPKSVSYQ